VTASLRTIVYMHQGVLEALVAKLASLGLVERHRAAPIGLF